MEKKICNKCGSEFSIEDFPFKSKKKGTKYPWCHECHKAYRREYYQKNREKIIQQDGKRGKDRKTRNRQFIWDYYKKNPCVDCGETNPIVLQFDHRDGVEKLERISLLVNNKCSIKTLKEEIDKCNVRCANCHHIRTSEQQGWYKDIIK